MDNYYVYREVGNRGFLNGEHGWELVQRNLGTIYLDGDFTDEEREEGCDLREVNTYIFRKLESAEGIFDGEEHEWYQYNTRIYIGDMYQYDFPSINEYHHKSEDEIDIANYEIGGVYEETEQMALASLNS